MAQKFQETSITIETDRGEASVPALIHPLCPGLALTMSQFGHFTVTHIDTGKKMCADFERAFSAMLILTKYQLIAHKFKLDWTNYTDGMLLPHMSKPVPFDGSTITTNDSEKKMTVSQWIQAIRPGPMTDEFPWEDTHPLTKAVEILERLAVG